MKVDLSQFPRLRVGHFPTPLEPLDNLSKLLGGPRIWIKRDDCTGLSTGGNKTRKLEFLMADALVQAADTIITLGGTQSNHARQTAAFAAKARLQCILLLELGGNSNTSFNNNGNIFLDRLHGATIEFIQSGTDLNQSTERMASALRKKGRVPYIIPVGGSNPTGVLGYVDAAAELVAQTDVIGLKVDYIVHASGSMGTQAGLIVGLAGLNKDIKVLGIAVSRGRRELEAGVLSLARDTAALVGLAGEIGVDAVIANADYLGAGYAVPTPEMIEAVHLLANLEGILLDPVYSGKAMAGLIDLVRQGRFRNDENIVFWHTGGSAALFGFVDIFADTCSGAL